MGRGTDQAAVSVKEANKAGGSLQVINETISRITLMNDQIANATGQQQTVAVSISDNVDDINSRTSDTSKSSQELTRVSESLADLAQEFTRIMQQFKY